MRKKDLVEAMKRSECGVPDDKSVDKILEAINLGEKDAKKHRCAICGHEQRHHLETSFDYYCVALGSGDPCDCEGYEPEVTEQERR